MPALTPPRPIELGVSYPKGESGSHSVLLELVIDEAGRVPHAAVLSGRSPFAEAALEAARLWQFSPALQNGVAKKVKSQMRVRFEEPQAQETQPPFVRESPSLPKPPPQPDRELGSDVSPDEDSSPASSPAPPAVVDVTVVGTPSAAERQLSQLEIKQLPGAFGDPFRAVGVLPGVTPIVTGLPYFYVRGAPPGNVGYLFDGIPVPVLYHLGLGPGVLHPAFIESVKVHAGAYPAALGRYSGGVVSGTLAEPHYERRGEASLRLVDSGGFAELPFADGRGSLMLGGRYSYTGAILSALDASQAIDYWDYQSRARWDLNENHTLEVLAFGSGDLLLERPESGGAMTTALDMNFHRLEARWDMALGAGNHLRQALLLGLDRSVLDDEMVRFNSALLGYRSELSMRLSKWLSLTSGASVIAERLKQTVDKPASEIGQVDREFVIDENGMEVELPQPEFEPEADSLGFDPKREDLTVGAYTSLSIDVTDALSITPGLRADFYRFGNTEALGLDPRLAAVYSITPKLRLTHDLGLVHQPPSFLIPIPGAKPSLKGGLQRSIKHSAGTEFMLPWDLNASVEVFQNLFFNLTDMLGVEQLAENDAVTTDGIRAKGRSYGLELLLRRPLTRRLGGLLSYTLARSERGIRYLEGPSSTDRTHVLNLALSAALGSNWRLGTRFIFYTGTPARLPAGVSDQHPPRAPAFWRLDWQLQKRWPFADGTGHWALTLEALNTTLNREITKRDCSTLPCTDEKTDPITIPNIGAELAF